MKTRTKVIAAAALIAAAAYVVVGVTSMNNAREDSDRKQDLVRYYEQNTP